MYSIEKSFDSMNLVRLVLGEFFNKIDLIWNTLIQVDRITVHSTVQNFTLCMDPFIRLYLTQKSKSLKKLFQTKMWSKY